MRTKIGAGLLLLMLAGCSLVSLHLQRTTEAIAEQLDSAAAQALSGDLALAIRTAEEARASWADGWKLRASFSHHSPMEQVDTGFQRLAVWADTEAAAGFAAECVQLAMEIRAIGDAGGPQWWNILSVTASPLPG